MPARRPPAPAVAILVRHGRTPTTGALLPGRAPGLHLSEEGLAQAEAAAARVGELRKAPVAVYASPLERTVETARPIARRLGLRVRVERGLLECDVGSWTGQKLARLRRLAAWRQVQQLPGSFRFPDGESFAEMQLRVMNTLDALAARHAGQSFVAVSHADPIRAAVAAVAGVPLDLFQRLVVSPCSISVLVRGSTSSHLVALNATTSLAELGLS